MKIERKITFFQSLVNVFLVTSLALSGTAIILLSQNTFSVLLKHTEFQIILANFSFLSMALISVNFLFRKFHQKQLSDKHSIDGLTGVMSRQNFVDVFEHILLDNRRSVRPLCLLMIDIDHFSRINEKHGYQTGDYILSTLGQLIQSVLRAPDIICRWSGDKFIVVLKDCTEKDACRIAAKILAAIRQQELGFEKKTIRVTGSIGIAQNITGDTVKKLIARAETGLHTACDRGRNTCAIGYDWILLEYYIKPIF
ncbi:MAG: GGDEF domain-containing protein [Desulfocapsa sp.]|nr:GGDEF domain-containing protein [Desulfocapsa sp.]